VAVQEERMNELDKLVNDKRVSNRMMAKCLRAIDFRNLVHVLLRAADETKKMIYDSVSKNVRKKLEPSVEEAREIATEDQIAYSSSLLARALTKLLEQGEIRDRPISSKEMPDEMPDINIENETEIIDTFIRLAKWAIEYGLLSLEGVQESISNPVFRKGLEYIVDGTDPFEVQKILENYKRSYLHSVERQLNMIIEGVMAIQRGDDPYFIVEMLKSFL
jgi:hypothetical protein